MEVSIKEPSRDELIHKMIEKGEICEDVAGIPNGLNISLYLNSDLSINLEKLEFAISYMVERTNVIQINGMDFYYKLRGIELNNKQRTEENNFILQFCTAVANEFSERGPIVVVFLSELMS